MSALLCLPHLDDLLRQGWAHPDCQRAPTDGRAWSPLCHPAAGLAVEVEHAPTREHDKEVLSWACGECQIPLGSLAGLGISAWDKHGAPGCDHDAHHLHVA